MRALCLYSRRLRHMLCLAFAAAPRQPPSPGQSI